MKLMVKQHDQIQKSNENQQDLGQKPKLVVIN
jgi:hypothetical protein